MAEGRDVRSEKETLGKSVKTQHKYGTANRTSSTSTYPEYYMRHIVEKGDTLPGIALKYGCSVSSSIPVHFSLLTVTYSWPHLTQTDICMSSMHRNC
jgi:hypothetical protein